METVFVFSVMLFNFPKRDFITC